MQRVLEPASRIKCGPEYIERLEALARSCDRETATFVATHNDLTAANVMLNRSDVGVIDWEEAEPAGLPLGDLVYAIADFAAASRRYVDRVASFEACFVHPGEPSDNARSMLTSAARALDLSPSFAELCLHSCWLMHADNEQRRDGGSADRPFREIVERIAAGGPPVWTAALFGEDASPAGVPAR